LASFDFDIVLNGHTLNAVGDATPYSPAVMYLRNGDPGYPAEGGEIEDLELWAYYRKDKSGPWRRRKLCQAVVDANFDVVFELIEEKLAEE
jgi:hypothetical protein